MIRFVDKMAEDEMPIVIMTVDNIKVSLVSRQNDSGQDVCRQNVFQQNNDLPCVLEPSQPAETKLALKALEHEVDHHFV
jgi:hypothetical protein